MGRGSFGYRKALSTRLVVNEWWCRFRGVVSAPSRGISRKYPALYHEAFGRFQIRDLAVDLVAWNSAYYHVRRELREGVGFSTCYSFEEAVERILYSSRTSSVGFEWNRYGQTKGEVLTSPAGLEALRLRLSDPITFAKRAVFTMSLKDELRDLENGVPKAARLFFPGELSLLIACVMVYGRWNDRFVDSFFSGSMGGSFLSGGADRLVRFLEFDSFGEGDARKFDSKQQQCLREMVYSLRDEHVESHPLKPDVHRILVSPVVLSPEGMLWQLYGGNPSGGFNTKVDNSILTMFVLAYAFYRKYPQGDISVVKSMPEGDDYVYGTCVNFTPADIAHYALELGLEYDSKPLARVGEVSFCQRRFLLSGGIWVARPDPQRALATMAINRCPLLLDLCHMSQSVLIENFYNEDIRKLIREFQEWAAQFVGDLGYLTDSAIDRLHKCSLKYEGWPEGGLKSSALLKHR